ncbi:MAG: type II secretion system ATPase GspE [Gammaproteobacteria bacterium]
MSSPDPVVVVRDAQPAKASLSFAFARRHGVLLTRLDAQGASITHKPGVALSVLSELRRHFEVPLHLETVSTEAFDRLLQSMYENQSDQTMHAMEGFSDEFDLNSIAEELAEPEDLLETEDDAPIIRLINALLTQAVKENASDIHIEPFENRLVMRLRVDGILREVLQPPRQLAPIIVSRIKVMAKLDIAEKRLPQDGRISLRIAGRAVDVRVSTLPSGHGERVVLRLLDKQAGRLDLNQLGMALETQASMDRLLKKPHGIILVTGPTGSGKTTTLYAGLGRLNDSKRNIMTVEDPIEYYIDGIGQTQVNTKVDMSFARGLRAILRQDPDVVMVGEIRDLDTVQIAVQASLTGHLVLSTLHTNTAVGAITRLRDMGVEPFLLSSSLIGVLAQRLVRVLCDQCKRPHTPDAAECAVMGIVTEAPSTETSLLLDLPMDTPPVIYEPVGCDACNHLGYRGRIGIYELIEIDDRLRTMIHDGASEQEMERHARKSSASIRQDGRRCILLGLTSLEEVLRVTHED